MSDTPSNHEIDWSPKDTPRTNAAAIEIRRPNPEGCDQLDWSGFARRLERELAVAKSEIARLLEENDSNALAHKTCVSFRMENSELKTHLAAKTAALERAEARLAGYDQMAKGVGETAASPEEGAK